MCSARCSRTSRDSQGGQGRGAGLDTDLLRSWLGLPPGGWPPADRDLLGPAATAEEGERHAMRLMSRLRPHQLRHPDLVTEGMNRLAQAMLAAGQRRPPSAPAEPTLPQPLPPPAVRPAGPPPPAPPKPAVPEVFDFGGEAVTTPLAAPAAAQAGPVILDAEVVEEGEAPEPVARFEQYHLLPAEVPRQPVSTAVPVPDVSSVPRFVPHGLASEGRRALYQELAALRALLRAWADLRTICGNPSEDVATPGRVCAFLAAADDFRDALRHPGFDDEWLILAPRVFAVFRSGLPLPVFRLLTPLQRRLLARDWATGQAELDARRVGLRESLRATKPQPAVSQTLDAAGRWAMTVPEVVLLIPGVVLVLGLIVKLAARADG